MLTDEETADLSTYNLCAFSHYINSRTENTTPPCWLCMNGTVKARIRSAFYEYYRSNAIARCMTFEEFEANLNANLKFVDNVNNWRKVELSMKIARGNDDPGGFFFNVEEICPSYYQRK